MATKLEFPEMLKNGLPAASVQRKHIVTVDFRTAAGTRNRVRADGCIITTPLSLLRHMEIERLDPQKCHAIRNSYRDRDGGDAPEDPHERPTLLTP